MIKRNLMREKRKAKKRARKELDDLKLILRRAKKRAPREEVDAARDLGREVRHAIKTGDPEQMRRTCEALDGYVDERLSRYRPSPTWETVKALLIALCIALVIRWLFIEPFRIPSGSMIPTLLVGDQLMVNKLSFGPDLYLPYIIDPDLSAERMSGHERPAPLFKFRLAGRTVVIAAKKLWLRRLPERGEVVVFRFPDAPRDDYIKRVVGLPGDKVETRDSKLYVNGELQKKELLGEYNGPVGNGSCKRFELFEEELDREQSGYVHDVILCSDPFHRKFTNHNAWTVPQGMLFMMGDNRDQSSDSRSWGLVPVTHLKGRAMFIHLPLDPENHYLPRWGRFFQPIR